jgi:short-subunit dehydrogenase
LAQFFSFSPEMVVWITGASSGIGEALATTCAAKGCRMVLSARNSDALEALAKRLQAQAPEIMVLPLDLAQASEQAGDWTAQVMARFGRIDVLVNNAGVSQRATALETPEALERSLFEVNYFAPVALSKAVLPAMMQAGGGQLVVVSSIAGKLGFFYRSTYSAAKHALHGYFESLRLEYEDRGIRVLMVCPGKVKTNISLMAQTPAGAHGVMDPSHAEAMTAEACAHEVMQAIEEGREEVLVGGKELWMVRLKRWWPSLFRRLLRRVLRT